MWKWSSGKRENGVKIYLKKQWQKTSQFGNQENTKQDKYFKNLTLRRIINKLINTKDKENNVNDVIQKDIKHRVPMMQITNDFSSETMGSEDNGRSF